MKLTHNRRVLSKNIASILALGLGFASSASAANVWDGGGADNLWSTLSNWDNDLFPGYGTLTFSGATQTTNVVDANISMNQLFWSGASPWTLNNANSAAISLFDNGGVQAKVENQSTGLVTVNAPVTFAATAGAAWGEINAVNGGLAFGSAGALTVNGSIVAGIKMFGSGQTTTFNNTVSAAGKWFATTGASAATVQVGGAFTSGDIYTMNGSTLKLNSGGSITTSGLRLGGDFGTTLTQNLALGATFQLTSATGGQTFASNINSVTGNTSGALMVDSVNTSGTNTLSGSVFLDSPLRMQVAAGGTLAATGVVSGASSLTKQGGGTLTLSGVNTFTGGVTLAAGTLNVNNAAALGNTATGALTVSANSTLDSTAGAITTTTAKALNLNADLVFTGTNSLNLNGGTLALGGAAGTRTLNVAANTLTVDRVTTAAGVLLSKTGAGTLSLSQSVTNNATTLAGVLDIQAGKVVSFADVTVAGLTGSGTYELGGTSRWLFLNGTGTQSFGGTIQNGAAALGLTKDNTGSQTVTGTVTLGSDFRVIRGGLTLSGTNTFTGVANVGLGTAYTDGTRPTLTLAGGTTTVSNNQFNIGTIANGNAVININAGTLNANRNAAASFAAGAGDNTRGFVNMSGGIVNSVNEFWVGQSATANAANAYGAMTMTGGTLNGGSWIAVGRNGKGVVNMSGGTINVASNFFTSGGIAANSVGVVNLSGTGTINVNTNAANGGYYVAETGTGILNMTGGAVNIATSAASGLNIAGGAGAGVASLNGGVFTTPIVKKAGAGSGILNFNGGTLKASAANATFMTGLTSANVFAGGATIDSNNVAITIAQPLLAPAGNGLTTIPVATGGAGYVDTPTVVITGGGGSGATAVANISGGAITGFTIVSPGTGYTSAPTVTIFGGGATTAATVGTTTFAANATTGGLTKIGAGTLTISSTTSTYGGATTINGGTLSVGAINNGGAAGSLGASSNAAANLVLNGGTLDFSGATGSTDRGYTISTGATGTLSVSNVAGVLTVSGSSAATNGNLTKTGAGVLSLTGALNHTGTTTVSAGVLGATGTVAGPVVVSGGALNAGYQTVGALTVPSLTLGNSGSVNFDFSGTNDLITISAPSTGLTLGTGTALNLFQAGGSTAFTTNGTYSLFDYTTAFTGTLGSAFIVANSQPGKIYSIADNTGATTIDLTIGDAVTSAWAVDADGLWSTGSNWTNGRPNSIGATANLTSAITGPRTVTVDGPQTVGNIVFTNANAYTVTGGATDVITLNNGLGTANISATSGSHSLNAPVVLVNPSALNADAGASLSVGGDISGAAGLTKIGNGTVSLAGTNSYTTTTVSAGTLQVGAGGTTGSLGSGAASIGVGATMAFNRSNAFTVSNNISGVGTLSQIGSGATTYAGAATHTGATNVTGGSLINEGTINGSTALNVNGGAFITQASGTTTIAGPTTVGATASGTLSLLGGASATLNGLVGIGTGSGGITGALTVNTTGTLATNNIVNVGVGTGANGTFTMTSGTVNQTGATNVVIGANGGSGTYAQSGGILNTGTANPGFGVAIGTQGSTGSATITGGTINAPGEVWIGNNNVAGVAPTNNGTMTMSAGAINSGSWFVVGRNTATGTLNLSGGTVTKGGAAGNFMIIGSLGGTGTVNQTGGAFNATAGGIRMGENTGAVPALAGLWDMQGGSSTVTGEVTIGWRSSEATWNIKPGATVNVNGRLLVASETANAAINTGVIVNGGPVGTVNMTGGTATFTAGDHIIGGSNSAVSVAAKGTVSVSGGTMNFSSNLQIGGYGQGTMNIQGTGTVNSTGGFPVVGRYLGGVGTLTVDAGGTFNQTGVGAALIIGEQGTGTMNIYSGGITDVEGLFLGHTTTGNSTVNLIGGTLATKIVQRTDVTTSVAGFNFDGGTLKAKASAANFFPGFTNTQIKVEAGGAVINTNGFDVGVTQVISDGLTTGGGLTKTGNGKLTLSGAETFTGLTSVNGGTLSLTGSLSGSAEVNIGGTLGGTGTITGTVTANSGATVSPGLSPGQLNTGAFTLNTGAALALEVNGTGAGNFDVLNVTGGVTLSGSLSLSGSYLTTPAVTNDLFFAIINDGSDPITGTFAGLTDGSHVYAPNGQDFVVSYFGDSVGGTVTGGNDFVLQAVPEPGSAALLLGGLAMLAGRRRRSAK